MDEGPVLRRRRLGGELKRCREAAGLTQNSVSQHFEWHTAKVTRIETARVAVTPRDVKDLLTLYGVHDEAYRTSLIELARRARERSWWSQYRDLLALEFVGLEAGATALRSWEPTVIPGLLQTEGYMRSLMRIVRPSESPENLERRIALRLTRQERLTAHPPLHLQVVIDESVLHRTMGSDEIMATQLSWIRERSTVLTNVFVQVLPLSAGAHPLLGGSVSILQFSGTADSDVVYLEGLAEGYEDRPATVSRFGAALDELSMRALDERGSMALVDSLLRAT